MNIFNLNIATMDAQKRTELHNPYTELTTTNAKVRSLEYTYWQTFLKQKSPDIPSSV